MTGLGGRGLRRRSFGGLHWYRSQSPTDSKCHYMSINTLPANGLVPCYFLQYCSSLRTSSIGRRTILTYRTAPCGLILDRLRNLSWTSVYNKGLLHMYISWIVALSNSLLAKPKQIKRLKCGRYHYTWFSWLSWWMPEQYNSLGMPDLDSGFSKEVVFAIDEAFNQMTTSSGSWVVRPGSSDHGLSALWICLLGLGHIRIQDSTKFENGVLFCNLFSIRLSFG